MAKHIRLDRRLYETLATGRWHETSQRANSGVCAKKLPRRAKSFLLQGLCLHLLFLHLLLKVREFCGRFPWLLPLALRHG